MSVLDRAIVKAFERRRVSEPAAPAAVAVPCAVVEDAPPTSLASATPVEDAARPSAPIESSVGSGNTLTVPQDAPPPLPQPVAPAPQQSSQPELTETGAKELPVPVEAPQPDPGQRQIEVATAPPKPPPALPPFVSYTVSTTNPSIDSKAGPFTPPLNGPPVVRDWKWPEICEQLDQFTGDGFRQLAKHLQFAAAQGHKVLAFVSSARAAGRTSVLLTLTRILALEGRTHCLLIDADRQHPDIATLTGLGPTPGLSEVLHGQTVLQQAIVPRAPGNISSLTLKAAVSEAEWHRLTVPMRALVQQARRDYDMVLIDAGVFGPETKLAECWLRGAADAVITISRQLTSQNAAHEILNWKQIGIESLGVIETFS